MQLADQLMRLCYLRTLVVVGRGLGTADGMTQWTRAHDSFCKLAAELIDEHGEALVVMALNRSSAPVVAPSSQA